MIKLNRSEIAALMCMMAFAMALILKPEPKEPICFKGVMVQVVDNAAIPLIKDGKPVFCEVAGSKEI